MKLSSGQLRRIIAGEIEHLMEMCGPCAAAGRSSRGVTRPGPGQRVMHSVGDDEIDDDDDIGELSKSEALALVAMIARRTSCPVTSDTLMDVVEQLGGEEDDHEGQCCEDAHPGDSHDAWARGSQASVPDLSELDPSDALGIGHGVGSGRITDYDISG